MALSLNIKSLFFGFTQKFSIRGYKKPSLHPTVVCIAFLLHFTCFGQTKTYLEKSKSYLDHYHFDSAYVYIEKAMLSCTDCSGGLKAKLSITHAQILKHLSETDESLKNLLLAEKIYEKQGNKDSLFYVKTLKAELFRFSNQKEKSIREIQLAEKIVSDRNKNILAYFYNRKLAIYNYWVNDCDSILDELPKKIYAIQDQVRDKEIIAYTMNEVANIKEQREGIDHCLESYLSAKRYAKANQLWVPYVDIMLNEARIIQYHNDFEGAIVVLHQALDVSKETNNLWQTMRVYQMLSANHHLNQDFEKALQFTLAGDKVRELIDQKTNWVKFKTVERLHNIELKNQEIEFKDNELSDVKKTLFLISLVLLLLFVAIVFLVYYYRKTKKNNRELDKLSQENAFLLGEANHRINNNLQLIIVLINGEMKKMKEEETIPFKKILSKVDSIATLHRHLYKADNKQMIEISEYFSEILNNFQAIFNSKKVSIKLKINKTFIPTDATMYLGLILTELCINTIKHAFDELQQKEILIEVHQSKDQLTMHYSDNGINAVGENIEPKLVLKLCKQIKAGYLINTEKGFQISINKELNGVKKNMNDIQIKE